MVKDASIKLQPQIILNPYSQCHGKYPYDFKRRALKDAHELAKKHPYHIFTVYHCPHCGKYHVGTVT